MARSMFVPASSRCAPAWRSHCSVTQDTRDTPMQVDVAVVGSGPAGMAAAVEAADAGASVLLLDEYAKPGGQFFKRTGDGFSVGAARVTREHQRGESLRAKLSHPRISLWARALVWGRFGNELM